MQPETAMPAAKRKASSTIRRLRYEVREARISFSEEVTAMDQKVFPSATG